MKYLLPIALLLLSFTAGAQRYSRVQINFDKTHQLIDLAKMGLEVDHGKYRPGVSFIGEFSTDQVQQIQDKGFSTEILVNDLQARLRELNAAGASAENRSAHCGEEQGGTVYETPENYTYGSMGGYITYSEMLEVLDQMATMYPNIFKAKQPITTAYTTHEGRPIYWVKISDNPETDEADEPEMLYTALHHAREPNSLSQMVFYMWYLLENYETDAEIKYLVDNTELYFVPCVNPDGYVYNETTDPDGGGFWRKNRRDNGDGSFGVDLNRNYPHEWGFDDVGSSIDTGSGTYRGPSAGSEPETQMIMEFCNSHHFRITLNCHTYSNLLIYPWGYIDGATPDHDIFKGFADAMTRDNNYLAGFGSETVGYTVNGDSDDWMYGEQTSKEKILSMTPEVGPQSTGFWPPQADIDGLNKDAMTMNLTAAHLLLNYGLISPSAERFLVSLTNEIGFNLKKLGLKQGLMKVFIEPISDNIFSVDPPLTFGMFNLEEVESSLGFTLDPSIQEGETVSYYLVLDNGAYQWKTQIDQVYASEVTIAFTEPGDDFSMWSTPGTWAATDQEFYSEPSSITDTPGGLYSNDELNIMEMAEPVMLNNARTAILSYWAKWEIEAGFDYVQVLLTVDGNEEIPLCGKYTEMGIATQIGAFEEPLYDGAQSDWVREEIDLSEYLPSDGEVSFSIGFQLLSDVYVNGDGFYFDDMELTVLDNDGVTSTSDFEASDFMVSSRPNPAKDHVYFYIESGTNNLADLNLQVFNVLGQLLETHRVGERKALKLETGNWENGLYYYHLTDGDSTQGKGRFVVSK